MSPMAGSTTTTCPPPSIYNVACLTGVIFSVPALVLNSSAACAVNAASANAQQSARVDVFIPALSRNRDILTLDARAVVGADSGCCTARGSAACAGPVVVAGRVRLPFKIGRAHV